MSLNRNTIILLVAVLVGVVIFGFWFYKESSRFYIGTKVEDLGRGHVPVGTVEKYNSNPPTSGPHYEEWTKYGIYNEPRDDRNLVHSLEHGYVILSYNCDYKAQTGFIPQAFALEPIPGLTGTMRVQDSTDSASPSASLSPQFSSDGCKNLIKDLSQIYNDKGKVRLIVIPRPNLDAVVAVSAWGYMDKWNTGIGSLSGQDKQKINSFIDAHLNKGPEKTIE